MNEMIAFITEQWGQNCVDVILASEPVEMTFDDFLTHCTACGGDWGRMLLTGLHELRPQVWEAIPNDMGIYAWTCICDTLELCGIEMPKDEGVKAQEYALTPRAQRLLKNKLLTSLFLCDIL